jgi:hypothetical protein
MKKSGAKSSAGSDISKSPYLGEKRRKNKWIMSNNTKQKHLPKNEKCSLRQYDKRELENQKAQS